MRFRDRIKELRRVKASSLRPHPKNWRTHPLAQRDALKGILAEIGYAAALLARDMPDGTLELIDGHLRAETTPDAEVPVLIVDLDDAETAQLLAVHDPIAAMAEADQQALAALMEDFTTDSDAIRAMLDGITGALGLPEEIAAPDPSESDLPIPESYQVVIECNDEDHQRELYERLTGEGMTCRLLTL